MMRILGLILLLMLLIGTAWADTDRAIVILDKDEGDKTIGELKPAYIDFKFRTSPRVPLNEVVLRYTRLIKEAKDSEVRIKALHRLANLEDIFGYERPEGMISNEIWQIAIASYEEVLKQHPFEKDNDWILYQLARAYEMIGQIDKTLVVLERLVGQYPKSGLVAESLFRIGELRFSQGDYQRAEKSYAEVLKSANPSLHDKALYMHGWTQYKQDEYQSALDTFLDVLVRIEQNRGKLDSAEAVEADTLRISSLIASLLNGPETLQQAIARKGYKQMAPALYKRLYQFYLDAERYQDAASTAQSYITQYDESPERIDFHVLKVAAYEKGRLPSQAWQEKELVVSELAPDGRYWNQQSPESQARINGLLYDYMDELGQRSYALSSQRKGEERNRHLLAATGYFNRMVELFPREEGSAQASMLAGESYYQMKNWAGAIQAYERAGYFYTDYSRRAEAAYAAILAYGEAIKLQPHDLALRAARVKALVRFAGAFRDDPRALPAILLAASEEYEQEHYPASLNLAKQVTTASKDKDVLRSAWQVEGHAAFALDRYTDAETAYSQALALRKPSDTDYQSLTDNLAASIYSLGEMRERQGNMQAALTEYQRVIAVAPTSSVRINAQYDAAMRAIDLAHWSEAKDLLNEFRQRFPSHTLTGGVGEKLVYVYLQSDEKGLAANELRRLSDTDTDPERKRLAVWQAADLYVQAEDRDSAIKLYEDYVKQYPRPFEDAVQGRQLLVELNEQAGRKSQMEGWQNQLVAFEEKGGNDRTPATKTLAAAATWSLLQPDKQAYDQVRLTLPLTKSLARKQALLKSLVGQLNQMLSYGISEYTTAANHMMGELYQQLGKDILESERPKNLSELEGEQYTLLLEEQAYPFEDKAIELLEQNASRTQNGIYDDWVKESYAALSELLPVRYNKQEVAVDVPESLQ